MAPKRLRIGTRASQLALWQANWTKSELEARYPGIQVELVKIKTMGDKILDVPLAQVGGKGLFVKEIEEAMLRGEIDLAVHSMKDVPTEFPEGLGLVVTTKREDPRDAFISDKVTFSELRQGARIGTSALRRQAQLLKARPDLEMVIIRGNVETRIRKLKEDNLDAVILAAAGLNRLGFTDVVTELLDTDFSIPAIGQGALGLECRLDDNATIEALAFLNHADTAAAVAAERALLKRCEGGCQVPIAAHGTVSGDTLTLVGFIASVDGKQTVRDRISGSTADAVKLGTELADRLLAAGGKAILEDVYQREIAH
ncbi:hydroxymethylbilane synthase [Trichlorobacter lovleyi]|jgi:hydroxymethylbilane synthase (EC 2.5.1.61)|uniref:Porphobilinogen deaminase n=1 Tax=Trichlorobacter lovleyi (strain ATCC BAA-1151 / DSM 17278 / SZ) TaxID=398767 RepID=HEM3_TRIL1|nr:hydroxymethylbilane synthase [Trichlorobacter lovleyi]B3E2H7.1 RecName: Full=Porphobilinogen deaminase; Short=PBG; AltName: Full=Hydroxymethylbilane synthase; Short=HMBS; AltName: Full=Pre-uroporphyrinogen synthase [Trichlorobacter lovleyi SZ]ACD94230.1 porphobilinogen deaminase [Trichlorobacter lovleyi SZ]QOX77727.1 hydroxymethylbilane synthase [Trichlorobacter lovleyi]